MSRHSCDQCGRTIRTQKLNVCKRAGCPVMAVITGNEPEAEADPVETAPDTDPAGDSGQSGDAE